jgi:hypothetical protein
LFGTATRSRPVSSASLVSVLAKPEASAENLHKPIKWEILL